MLLDKVFNDFISYITYEENYSKHTLKAYKSDTLDFINYIKSSDILNINDLKYFHVRAYISSLYNTLDRPSIARKISSIRTFLKYCLSNLYIEAQVLNKIKTPKQAKKIVFTLRDNEIDALMNNYSNKNKVLSSRNIAILSLLYASGIRVSELSEIKIEDIDFNLMQIKVFSKGRKERYCFFNKDSKDILMQYLNHRNILVKKDKANSYLFLNQNGTKISVRLVQRLVKLSAIKANIVNKTTPHTLRHSFATNILEQGASIKTVKELLGHKSINATQRYTHLSMESLLNTYKKAHPKAKE